MRVIFIGLLTLLFVTFLSVFTANCEQRLQSVQNPSLIPFIAKELKPSEPPKQDLKASTTASQENSVKLEVIYPKNGATIKASSVFFEGNTDSKACLLINNQSVNVYPNGAFVQVVALNRGVNNINIKSTKEHAIKEIHYTINVPEYEQTIPSFPVMIKESTISPSKNILYREGDIISVSFKASTGLKASFSIGEKVVNIPIIEQAPKNISTEPVYGKTEQISAMPVKGYYKGFYKIKPEDKFKDEVIKVELASDKEKISAEAKGKISTISAKTTSTVAEIINDYAITRTTPGQSRLTPLPLGTILDITGKIGDNYRFKYSDSMDGWISESDVKILPAGNFCPESIINLLNINSDENYVYFDIPISTKTPFLIEQPCENQINLKLFGVKAGIDLISYDKSTDFIKEIKWTQESKDCLNLAIKINSKQFWGYKYYYKDNSLILRLRKQPQINPVCPLYGKIICIDPGHGGTELGAIGPTGIPEKTVNLGIAEKLRKILEEKGAKVIMTRNFDEAVGLNNRVNIANYNEAQVIISIHNNSLPNGRNPYQEHGTSTYYYHSQSLPLAKSIQQSLVQSIEFKNFGVFYDSLVITRSAESLSVLTEVGFMINPDEYNLLITSEFQEKAATGIAQGLENFFLSQI